MGEAAPMVMEGILVSWTEYVNTLQKMEKIHLPADKNIHKLVRLHLYRDIGKSVKREVVQYQQKPPPSCATKQQNEPMDQWTKYQQRPPPSGSTWTNGNNFSINQYHQGPFQGPLTELLSWAWIYILSRNIYFPKLSLWNRLSLQIFNMAGSARVCELVFVATFEGAFSEYLAVFDLFSYMKWYMTNSSSMASLLQILTLASTTVLANKSLFIHYSLLAIFETI